MSVRRDDPTLTYTFERCIGKGSYGKVYRAVPKAGGETVAFKVLPLEDGESSISLDMRRELLSLRECDHPRVVRYHDAYIRDNRLWIAMEYCLCSAQGVIRTSQRPLSEPQLACVLVEALRGLHYLHSERQIIHRDVKAGNILITAEGQGAAGCKWRLRCCLTTPPEGPRRSCTAVIWPVQGKGSPPAAFKSALIFRLALAEQAGEARRLWRVGPDEGERDQAQHGHRHADVDVARDDRGGQLRRAHRPLVARHYRHRAPRPLPAAG